MISSKRRGPGALARDQADIESCEQQFDTVSHTSQPSLSPKGPRALSSAQ
jgi:hypothetical protein